METRRDTPNGAGRTVREEPRAEESSSSPLARALAEWLQLFGRTVKTCRLYDAGNPTVSQFRHDLAAALEPLLQTHGAAELSFAPESIFLGETPLYSARSREDNLALPFFRDGIRSISLLPGIASREVDALLDAFLHVTRRGYEDSDLVTLIWEAGLEHVSVRYVTTEGDVESGGDGAAEDAATAGSIAPWPRPSAAPAASAAPPSAEDSDASPVDDTGRSDDRITASQVRQLEASLLRLEIEADTEVARFRAEFEAERTSSLAHTGFGLIRSCLAHVTRDPDRQTMREFLPRLLHEAVAQGEWNDARECLYLLRDPRASTDPVAAFIAELSAPDSLTSVNAWKRLDAQTPDEHEAFFDFARELGVEATDWLMHGIAESNRKGLRQSLVQLLASLVSKQPERLAPWLADERWYVVRNVIHLFGQLESGVPVGLLRAVSGHPEPRVRREVIATLARAPRDRARPILMDMLKIGREPLFASVLRVLATGRDPELATMLIGWIEQGAFASWPDADRRAVYLALASVGGDDVVPLLEPHLMTTHWFSKGDDGSRIGAALCLARIATPAARALLERGAKSRHSEVARASLAGLASMRPQSGGAS